MTNDDLLKYVELDLWSRFSGRLWKAVGAFITIATLAGLFGVPYYIKTEIDDRLKARATDFEARSRDIYAHSKLLAVLSVRYSTALSGLRADVYGLVDAMQTYELEHPPKVANARFHDPADELLALISRDNFEKVVTADAFGRQVFYFSKEDGERTLLPPMYLTVENPGIRGGGMFREVHPLRDGTYRGAILDIKYRIVMLEALRRAMTAVEDRLLSLGGTSKLEGQMESLRVQGLESDVLLEELQKQMGELSKSFLSKEERREFMECRRLYVMGYNVSLPDDTPVEATPGATPAKSARLQ